MYKKYSREIIHSGSKPKKLSSAVKEQRQATSSSTPRNSQQQQLKGPLTQKEKCSARVVKKVIIYKRLIPKRRGKDTHSQNHSADSGNLNINTLLTHDENMPQCADFQQNRRSQSANKSQIDIQIQNLAAVATSSSGMKPPKPSQYKSNPGQISAMEFETIDTEFSQKYDSALHSLELCRNELFKSQCNNEALKIELSQLKQSQQRQQVDFKKALIEIEQQKVKIQKNTQMLDQYKTLYSDFQKQLDFTKESYRKEIEQLKQKCDSLQKQHALERTVEQNKKIYKTDRLLRPQSTPSLGTIFTSDPKLSKETRKSIKTQTSEAVSIDSQEVIVLRRQVVELQIQNSELKEEASLIQSKLLESQQLLRVAKQDIKNKVQNTDYELSSILASDINIETNRQYDFPRQQIQKSPEQISCCSSEQQPVHQIQSEQIFSEGRKLQQSSIQQVRPPKLPLPLIKDQSNNPFQTVLVQQLHLNESQTERQNDYKPSHRSNPTSLFGGNYVNQESPQSQSDRVHEATPALSQTTQSLLGRRIGQDLKLKEEIRTLDNEIESLQACLRAAIKK